MPVDVIEVRYGELEKVAQSFEQQSKASLELQRRVRRAFDALQGGGWAGEGSEAFCLEMTDRVLPALERLSQALTEGCRATRAIAREMEQAEREAARLFQSSRLDEGLAAEADPGSVASQAAWGATVTGTTQPISDANQLFQDSYMRSMIDYEPKGANDPQLNDAMQRLLGPHTREERERALQMISDHLDVPPEQIRNQYVKYCELRDKAIQMARTTPDELPAKRSGFLGTTVSLRYGKVVGDVLGLNPVFGAMLNPTGGLMGPGAALPDFLQPDKTNPLSYHSVFHDAAGYLKVYHDIGPGYDYTGQDSFARHQHAEEGAREGDWLDLARLLSPPAPRAPTDPLNGHVGGINYWRGAAASDWFENWGAAEASELMYQIGW